MTYEFVTRIGWPLLSMEIQFVGEKGIILDFINISSLSMDNIFSQGCLWSKTKGQHDQRFLLETENIAQLIQYITEFSTKVTTT